MAECTCPRCDCDWPICRKLSWEETDAEVDRIMSLTDEEVIAEVRAEGLDPDLVAAEMRAIVQRAITKTMSK